MVSQRISDAPTLVSNWICGYGFPLAWNGPAYSNAVGWFLVPFGHADAWYDSPSKSRSPFWYLLSKHWLASDDSVAGTPSIVTGRVPFWKQLPSANSQFAPLVKSLVGHATGPFGPSVDGFWQMPVFGSHGPSPVWPGPSDPPTQVSKTFGSL